MGLFGLLYWQDLLGKGPLWKDRSRHRKHPCPRCGQSLDDKVCRHCGCRTDESGKECSSPADPDDPQSW